MRTVCPDLQLNTYIIVFQTIKKNFVSKKSLGITQNSEQKNPFFCSKKEGILEEVLNFCLSWQPIY